MDAHFCPWACKSGNPLYKANVRTQSFSITLSPKSCRLDCWSSVKCNALWSWTMFKMFPLPLLALLALPPQGHLFIITSVILLRSSHNWHCLPSFHPLHSYITACRPVLNMLDVSQMFFFDLIYFSCWWEKISRIENVTLRWLPGQCGSGCWGLEHTKLVRGFIIFNLWRWWWQWREGLKQSRFTCSNYLKVLSLEQELSCTLPPLPAEMSGHTVDVVGGKVLPKVISSQPHEHYCGQGGGLPRVPLLPTGWDLLGVLGRNPLLKVPVSILVQMKI